MFFLPDIIPVKYFLNFHVKLAKKISGFAIYFYAKNPGSEDLFFHFITLFFLKTGNQSLERPRKMAPKC